MELTDRQRHLVEILAANGEPVPADKLAVRVGVSPKTVRNDVHAVNAQLGQPEILAKRGRGYYLSADFDSRKIIRESPNNKTYQLLRLMMDEGQINIADAADVLFISESSLQIVVNDLNQIIEEFSPEGIIVRRNNTLFLTASESDRRGIVNGFLNHEIRKNKIGLDNYNDFFPGINLNQLLHQIIKLHQSEKLHFNDFMSISFVLHVAVLIDRVRAGSIINEFDIAPENPRCLRLANRLRSMLEDTFNVVIPDQELRYLYRLYLGQLAVVDVASDARIADAISQTISGINETFHVDFSRDVTMRGYLERHVSLLVARAKVGKFLINPLTAEIKTRFPFVYNISVYASLAIQKKLAISFPDDEIAYIALHFLSGFENVQDARNKQVLLLTPYGVGLTNLICNRLREIEGVRINLSIRDSMLDVVNEELDRYDLVLTTETWPISPRNNVYRFNNFLTDTDMQMITLKLTELENNPFVLKDFLNPDLFFSDKQFKTPEDVIRFLCGELTRKGYCPDNYVDLVLEREEISSTAYENYHAIPHAIQRVAKRNAIAVCTLRTPILWGEKSVKLVLLIALEKEWSRTYEVLFDELVHIFDTTAFVKNVAKASDFHDFLSLCYDKLSEK